MVTMRHFSRTLWVIALTAMLTSSATAQRTQSSSDIPNEKIFSAIGLAEGSSVGEIGAGNGELSVAAAKVVGATGKVYTSELGDERVQSLSKAIKSSGLSQITVVAGDPNETKFPESCCDAVFMRNVYHHFADPATMNGSIFRSLKPGGRLAIIDFTPPNKEAERPSDRDEDGMHGVSPESVARELKAAGFAVTDTQRGSERWFMVVAMKGS